MSGATAAVPARREWTHLQFLWLLAFSSSLLACSLPTMGSANTEHSEKTARQLVLWTGSAVQTAHLTSSCHMHACTRACTHTHTHTQSPRSSLPKGIHHRFSQGQICLSWLTTLGRRSYILLFHSKAIKHSLITDWGALCQTRGPQNKLHVAFKELMAPKGRLDSKRLFHKDTI